jgi:electron transfer flavoprotein alpha subunit
MATVQSADAIKMVTVRTTAFAKAAAEGGSAPVEAVEAADDPGISGFVGHELSVSERPELTSARIIISGGRGMQSGENFSLLEGIADKLGAAIGASRAAVDAGFVPNDFQVGQTGKIVARRHPASRRDEGQQGHRRHQQGRRGADLPGRRLWPGGGPLQGPARAGPGT